MLFVCRTQDNHQENIMRTENHAGLYDLTDVEKFAGLIFMHCAAISRAAKLALQHGLAEDQLSAMAAELRGALDVVELEQRRFIRPSPLDPPA